MDTNRKASVRQLRAGGRIEGDQSWIRQRMRKWWRNHHGQALGINFPTGERSLLDHEGRKSPALKCRQWASQTCF